MSDDDLLPDALAKALGLVVADAQDEWKKEFDRMCAESRAILAEAKAENAALRVELKEQAAVFKAEIAEALAKVKDGEPGRDGKDADPEEVRQAVAEAVAAIPVPQNGKDADEPAIEARVTDKVLDALRAIPAPKDGAPGKDADPVTPEMVIEAVKAMPESITEAVSSYLTENPPPAGKDGTNGECGPPGPAGRDGRDGLPGVPGEKGRDGIDGKNGKDGLSVENFEAGLKEDGRTFVVKLIANDVAHVHEFVVPFIIDRGVFKAGEEYQKGDAVSYAGSLWIAQKDAPEGKPDDGNGGWRLAVKRGRDGKDKVPD